MQPNYQKQAKTKLITICVTVVVIIGVVVLIDALKNNSSSSNTTVTTPTTASVTPSTTQSQSSSSTTATSTSYKDGTYSATSTYYVPHGYESIKVTLTVANGVVTNSDIVNSEDDHESAAYQQEFASSYKSYVVGKNISDINLSYVAGASDTTDGFNDAVSQIRNDAQA